MRLIFAVYLFFLIGCATPLNSSIFTGPEVSENEYSLSSKDLLVAGLLGESVSWGERGRLHEAESQLRKAQWLSPDSSAVRFNLAVVLAQQGQHEEAKSLLTALMNAIGKRPEYLLVFADIQRQEADYHSARLSLKAAFLQYLRADNKRQAALVARSISNLAFLIGEEQEALCYSYESLNQITDGSNVARHALLLLGVNHIVGARDFLLAQINGSSELKNSGFIQFVLSLTKVALGDIEGAKADIKLAKQLSVGSIDYKDQLEAVRFLLLDKAISDGEDSSEIFTEEERLRDFAEKLSEEGGYTLLFWPENVREMLWQSLFVPSHRNAIEQKKQPD